MTVSFDALQASERLTRVHTRIAAAAQQSGREPHSVRLLAVSKLQPSARLQALYGAGQRAFGENYVQEGIDKITELHSLQQFPDIEWHLIGPLQSNKTRVVAERFNWVHSLDRTKIAERLSAQRPDHLPPLNLCIQVNVSGESSKSGCLPEEALSIVDFACKLPRVVVRGLMGMPEPGIGEAATRTQFMLLSHLFVTARAHVPTIDTLSMGMSDDLELAVACGSTMVRVGTALFGQRPGSPEKLEAQT